MQDQHATSEETGNRGARGRAVVGVFSSALSYSLAGASVTALEGDQVRDQVVDGGLEEPTATRTSGALRHQGPRTRILQCTDPPPLQTPLRPPYRPPSNASEPTHDQLQPNYNPVTRVTTQLQLIRLATGVIGPRNYT